MIDSPALVYHGAAAAARFNKTAELAQKGSEMGRKGEEGKLWALSRAANLNGHHLTSQFLVLKLVQRICKGDKENSAEIKANHCGF